MEWDEIKTQWPAYRASCARRWAQISDRELDQIDGDRERLSRQIQEAYLISADDADREISQWLAADRSTPGSEPGVSEDDAVPGCGGNSIQGEAPCHSGYMDDEK
jgi:uncharacterized protein YjbJ (UPF0337 family)